MTPLRPSLATRTQCVVAAAIALLPLSCHRERTPLERGSATFQRNCSQCHGPDGKGTHPPGFTIPPRNLTDPDLQARLTDAMIKETIRFGKGQMPNFGAAFADTEVSDLIVYVRSLQKPASATSASTPP